MPGQDLDYSVLDLKLVVSEVKLYKVLISNFFGFLERTKPAKPMLECKRK